MSLEARATGEARGSRTAPGDSAPACCPYYHEAVELIGRRWTGAIAAVLLDGAGGTLRSAALQQDLAHRARAQRPPALRAHEGTRGARRRFAPRRSRPAR